MLPRDQRLRAREDFQRVYRSGRGWAHPLMVLHVVQRPAGKRAGFSISKKVGNAVVRNRLRRRLREIVRSHVPGWKEGLDAVFVARPDAAAAPFEELAAVVAELARRARLVREPEQPPDSPYIMPARPAGKR